MSEILKIKDNQDKASTYKKLMDRYNDAHENGYYLECLLLDYAMMEDRMNRILCTLGVAQYGDGGLEVREEYEESLKTLLKKNPDNRFKAITTISDKRNIVINLLKGKGDNITELSHMKDCLKKAESKIEMKAFLKSTIKVWLEDRNNLIHAMFNKQYDSAMERLPAMVDDGKKYADTLGNYARRLKTQMNKYMKENGKA